MNTMVTLKNIKRDNDCIICDVYPEDSKLPVHMEVSVRTGDVSQSAFPKGYEYCTSHIRHAKRFLLENADHLPESRLIMWY